MDIRNNKSINNKNNSLSAIGVYIHIPFCEAKCSYCDFLSFNLNNKYLEEQYMIALKKEIVNTNYKIKTLNSVIKSSSIFTKKHFKIYEFNYNSFLLDTIYFGGGTPSLINAKYIKEIIEILNTKFIFSKNIEITIEANPESISKEKLKIYKEAGINRISIGLQTTNNTLLQRLGRIHTFEEFKEKYHLAKEYFNNINIDLIFGLPTQDINMLKNDLDEILKLNPEHISVYSLIIEENTKLYKEISQYEIKMPEDTLNRDMYWFIKTYLEDNNYNHYEISNFCKFNKESKHNINCWKQREYLGYGIGASSYYNNSRFSNILNLPLYIDNTNNNAFDLNIEEIQTKLDKQKEYMLLHLRLIEGVNIDEFKKEFQEDPVTLFKTKIEKLLKLNLITIFKTKEDKYIKLTNKGLDLANLVWQEFI